MNEEAIDEAIEVLNRIHEKDPSVLPQLIFHRVPCNVELAGDRTVQVGRAKSESGHAWEVGLLGIINGLFGADEHGWGHIYANFEEHRLVNFSRKPEPPSEVR